MITVYLSHGLESGPGALKVQALKGVAERLDNVDTVVMDYRQQPDPRDRLEHLRRTLAERGDDPARCVMAGSSLGGWVSAMLGAEHAVLGCFLLAPALGIAGYPETSPVLKAQACHLIHGWQDDVVAPGPVIDYARDQRLSLRLLDDDHRLHASLSIILGDFERFLHHCEALAGCE
ncbi:YqiA/YcfP family alpha/beta fold hydrolase [Halomonas garicola]|uniref:YqiA/YcfP family alpha/beta fold hydrolase n=1 Tax=Halomonas garicola TaxID=1690008 RepID=UPI00289C55F5|nr:YqiA/YcfP family alpha/beta fold hydrolase [Halomonas garicola]